MYVGKTAGWLHALALLGMSLAGSVGAQALTESQMVPVQDAFEGVEVMLTTGSDGEVLGVGVKECENCPPRTLLPSKEIQYLRGGEAVSINKALTYNGQPGAVIFNSQSRMVEKVVFYGR